MKKLFYAMDEIKAWVKSAYSVFLLSWFLRIISTMRWMNCIYNLTKTFTYSRFSKGTV